MVTSLAAALALAAAEPCEAPRIRDTAPLYAAIAQDKVLAQTFARAAAVCAERGDACDQARLECGNILSATIQKQVGFDEGMWLRDMLLPYLGATYAPTRTFGAVTLATDASCNVDVATLTAAGQRRQAQALRREGLAQEYALYVKWAQAQHLKCKESQTAEEARAAAARAEAERLAAAAAAATAAEQLKQKQAQEAAAAKAEEERKAREAAEAQARKEREAKEAALAEQKRREEAERLAREEREKDRKAAEERERRLEEERKREKAEAEAERKREKEEAERQARREKEEAERKAKEAEARRFIEERNARIAQQREYKARIVREAEEALERAKAEEIVKKQQAVAAVDKSPAIAQAAVAEAAQAEKARVAAEKNLFDARQKAEAIVIDDSHERSRGSLLVAGGGAANVGGFALGVLGGAHLGFWGDAPPDGMASGFEIRLWGRYSGQVVGTAGALLDSLVSARYFFGRFGVGFGGSFTLSGANPGTLGSLGVGVGPSLGIMLVDTPQWRVGINAASLLLGTTVDPTRFTGDLEVSWRFLTFQVHGGSLGTFPGAGGPTPLQWTVGAFAGARFSW
jgi:hypothetical protein